MYLLPLLGVQQLRQPYIDTLMWVVVPESIHQVCLSTEAILISEQIKAEDVPFLACQAWYLVQSILLCPLWIWGFERRNAFLSCFAFSMSPFLACFPTSPLHVCWSWCDHHSRFACAGPWDALGDMCCGFNYLGTTPALPKGARAWWVFLLLFLVK